MLRFRTALTLATVCVLAIAGLVVANKLGFAREDRTRGSGFSVVLNTTESGIAATCEQGCAWETLTAEYPNDEYMISSSGVHPTASPVADTVRADFHFHLMLGDNQGIRARCAHGCSWRSLTGTSSNGEYRITAEGVEAGRALVR